MPTPRFKYPRTPHLPTSPGASPDDLHLASWADFTGQEVVVTEKMDGENTTIYPDGLHARSTDSAHHPSRAWVKALQATVGGQLPAGWRLCGENLYARHSLPYDDLPSYFLLFSVWDDTNTALSWRETEEWAALLGLSTVPVRYQGPWSPSLLPRLLQPLDLSRQEGLVMRRAGPIPYAAFGRSTGKWVRAQHVSTGDHWMHQAVVPNGLRRDGGVR